MSADEAKVNDLAACLKINPTLCRILTERGIDSFEKARDYFRPQLSELHDPMLMKDMGKAVGRITTAFDTKEKILVFGDYDVDGTTSVACMYCFLCKIYEPSLLEFYIPHRYREGYGVSRLGIEYAKQNNFSLIISLDCGIKSIELISYAKDLGLDFIVCDHHLPDVDLPPAIAILNPKQKDCRYPFKELCGCGVGFKLITALCKTLALHDSHFLCYLDLVAIATAADIVQMSGENRILTYYGLQKINNDPSPGIKALVELSGIQKNFSINNVVFIIAPRVNAAGRMDDAKKAVMMFIEDDYKQAKLYVQMLQSDNSDRQEADSSITEEALIMIETDTLSVDKKSTVVFKPEWHKGVVGIVASRLIEKYYKPTVVLTQHGDIVSGSARSVNGFNLYEAIHACREHLIGYGGHFAAAGMTMIPSRVEAFSDCFELAVSSVIKPDSLIPEIVIDAEIDFRKVRLPFYNLLCQMEPYGPGNLRPVFITKSVMDTGYSKIVKDHHIRFVVKQGNIILTGIGFNLADKFHLIQLHESFDIIYTIDENEWQGEKTLQLKIIDLRLSDQLLSTSP